MPAIPNATPAPPYRLIRAMRYLQTAIIDVEGYKTPNADDQDMHHALDMLMRVKMILGKRIDKDLPK